MNENIPKKTIIGYLSLMNTMVTSIRIDNAWSFMLVVISWKCNVFKLIFEPVVTGQTTW